ncbi:hypothetical protein [Streptomyces sp. NRRL F-5122]|uniref:hypothetical protein n=1 Tax=Streptomyces sp. NRRL F-5122 TaxID=1609098 RepID=UPI000B064094|nr:hypothetical protein [Streptomyces sp. NRRL F-5122]
MDQPLARTAKLPPLVLPDSESFEATVLREELVAALDDVGCRHAVNSTLTFGEQSSMAVERVSRCMDTAFRRVNLEILGNTDGFLHAHVWPRFEWEPTDLVGKPVWLYPCDRWTDEQFALGPQHDSLREAIEDELDRLSSAN